MRTLTTFPSSAPKEHPTVIGAPIRPGKRPLTNRDGPTKTFVPKTPREGRPLSVDQGAFDRLDGECSPKRLLLLAASRVGLSLTPPTFFPQVGERNACSTGIASVLLGFSPELHIRESKRLFFSLRWFVPGTDDPSTPVGAGRRRFFAGLIASLVPPPAAAP
jgi:hypothetical protein